MGKERKMNRALKDMLDNVREWGKSRYDDGYASGYRDGQDNAKLKSMSVRDVINYAYKEGKCEAEQIAQENERRFEEEIGKLQDEIKRLNMLLHNERMARLP